MQVLIPTVERAGRWDDVDLCLQSLQSYAPQWAPLVAWKGTTPPPPRAGVTYLEQPETAAHYGHAIRFLISQASDEDLIMLNDDTVLTPWTAERLEEDIARISREPHPMGLVGMRSNMVAGSQNIRQPNTAKEIRNLRWVSEDDILAVPVIFGVGCYVRASALARVDDDWTNLHWYSDNLLSYDLQQLGYQHFISRAYLHHHGSRSTESWAKADAEAKAWLWDNRPDFCGAMGWDRPD